MIAPMLFHTFSTYMKCSCSILFLPTLYICGEAYFVKLALKDASGAVVSDNFYWQGREEGNYQALRTLPKTKLHLAAKKLSSTNFEVTLENRGEVPALMIRLKVKDSATDDLALPVWYSDNYFFLMPGERKVVDVQLESLKGHAVFEAEYLNR